MDLPVITIVPAADKGVAAQKIPERENTRMKMKSPLKFIFKKENFDTTLKDQKCGRHNQILVQKLIMHRKGISTLRHRCKQQLPLISFTNKSDSLGFSTSFNY